MEKSMFRAICLAAMGVFLASLTLIMGVLYDYFSQSQQAQLKAQLELAAQAVDREGQDYLDRLSDTAVRITWVAADGAVLFDSESPASGMENHLDREEIQEALSAGFGESARYSSTLTERRLYAAKKLTDGTVLRVSSVHLSPVSLVYVMLQPIAIVAIIAVVLALALASGLSKKIIRPLNQLDLDAPDENKVYKELRPLLHRIGSQKGQLRVQMERSEKLRREFTANVSHELKTPLQSISGYAELLKEGMVKPEDQADFSGRIYWEAQRMIALVDDILKLSRLDESSSGDMRWETVDLAALAQEAVESLRPAAEKAGVALSFSGAPALLTGVPQLLSGVVHNLCDNAIKYNREGGSVWVEVDSGEIHATLTVRDTGIGIPPEHQARVFERFYRVDKSRSKAVGGTGLGLSIVKHTVRLHCGEIDLHSEMGEGTTVTVRLPKSAEMGAQI